MKKLILAIAVLGLNLGFTQTKTICGETDDRILSEESEIGRASSMKYEAGCTITMISNSCAITAGHCFPNIKKVSFNVPHSVDTSPQASKLEDVYLIDQDSIVFHNNGEGDDWGVFKLKKNSITGLFPGEAQGYLSVRLNKMVRKGEAVRVTGFGADSQDPIRNFAQQTHYGKILKIGGFWASKSRLGYNVDTMGGNSGSSVVLEKTREIIGVHSHGTCNVWGAYNSGTLISKNEKLKTAIKNCLAE